MSRSSSYLKNYPEKEAGSSSSTDSVVPAYDAALEKRILRKVDLRLVPFLGIIYSIALIDRSNMPVARIAGMGTDLNLLVGDRYSIVSAIFFVPYILFQLPSNIILRRFGAKQCISFYVVAWGIVQIAMAYVPNWELLVLCRVLLGLFEAGFFAGMVFIITTWYKRDEVQQRLAIFYLTGILINGFGNILAYGLQLLKGKRGLNGWQWIFIVEGALTVLIGILAWFLIDAFPDQNKFLSKEHTAIVLDRVDKDRGDALPDSLNVRHVISHLSDWTLWAYGLMYMCSTMPAYVIAYFANIILQGMGWSLAQSFTLGAPPFVVAAFTTYVFARLADNTKKRALFMVCQTLCTIVGLAITGYAKGNGVRYFGLFMINIGASACIPSILAWSANNVVGHSKRSASTALTVSWGGIGGIFATTVFRQVDAPRYLNGVWATMGCQFLMLLLTIILALHYKRQNRLAKEGKIVLEGREGFLYTI